MKVWIVEWQSGEDAVDLVFSPESVHATEEGARARLAEWEERGKNWYERARRVTGPWEVEP